MTVQLQLTIEAFVTFVMATLTAGSVVAAYHYLLDREWTAVVFLSLAAFSTVWYGIIILTVVRAVFSIS
ncbi:MAG: hypothetical protein U0893_25375 [Chloroflexota bacterium]